MSGRIVLSCPVADLKKDLAGQKEYQDYLKKIDIQRDDLRKRIAKNKEWIVSWLLLKAGATCAWDTVRGCACCG